VPHFRVKFLESNILVLVQAVFMQNYSSLALKLRKKFEIKDRGRKKERVIVATLIDYGCKADLASGGLAWAPCNRIRNLSWSWVGEWGNFSLS